MARLATGSNIVNWSSTVELRFLAAKVSVADPKIATDDTPRSSARSSPRSLGTRTGIVPRWSTIVSRSSASASWGTHRGDTKLVISTVWSPAASIRRTNSALTSTGTIDFSFCNPSRAPTS